MNSINIIDLFCGTGGFAHGFLMRDKRLKLIYAIDINPHATLTTKLNHVDCRVDTEDIRNIDPYTIVAELNNPTVDLIIGGPPCQGFSSLRPNRSSNNNDERNKLFVSFAKFVECFKPTCFVLENVVGLVTHKHGLTLRAIFKTFSKLGYVTDWRIMNAASFGVPQKRERFILIGLKDYGKIIFPEPTHFFEGKVIGHRDRSRIILADENKPRALTVNDAIGDLPILHRNQESNVYALSPLNKYQAFMRGNESILTLHRSVNHSDKMMEVIKYAGNNIRCIPEHLISSGFSSCYSRLNANEPSTTITVKFQSPASSKCIHPFQDRTITPREAARIQSFPDSYKFFGSRTQIAEQIGNAVPPLLGMAIAQPVIQMIESYKR